jgi:hypothetical protein
VAVDQAPPLEVPVSYYFAELSRLLWEEAAFEPLKCRSASNPMLIVEAAGVASKLRCTLGRI